MVLTLILPFLLYIVYTKAKAHINTFLCLLFVVQVRDQKQVVLKLLQLAQALAAHQEQQADALAALQARQANLSQRMKLVQQLHWAMPRPASKAEQQMAEQLDVRGGGAGGNGQGRGGVGGGLGGGAGGNG